MKRVLVSFVGAGLEFANHSAIWKQGSSACNPRKTGHQSGGEACMTFLLRGIF
jgi:hypothetical protein